jgi:organic radical activating enzyme
MSKKLKDFEWNTDGKGNLLLDNQNRGTMKKLLDSTGPGFCLAKWTQVTMHLGNGLTHSCHHPGAHKIPLDELKENPGALHNTKFKKERRKEMLTGERPAECDFCWRVEDNGEISDRVLKSLPDFSSPHHDKISQLHGDEDIFPTYVEVSFGRTCNFACSYCGPPFSSKWEQDIKNNGVYNILNHKYNAIRDHEKHYNQNEKNPYIEAFWEWFPEAYKHMKTFRITGGEPLLMKDTFKVIDFLIENPNPNLEFAINSNACPPGDQWEKFVEKIKVLTENHCVKKFDLFTSAEAVGDRCDYIRDGMNWDLFVKNIEYFLENTRNTRVVFMAAFNILSLSTFKELLEWILELKTKYSYHGFFRWLEDEGYQRSKPGHPSYNERITHREGEIHNRIGIDIPYVRHPQFLDPGIASKQLIEDYLLPALDFMYSNLSNIDYYISNKFEDYECMKLKRNTVDCILKAKHEDENGLHKISEISNSRAKFANFVQEYDRRRKKKFLETFPEYTDFYNICIAEYQKNWGAAADDVTFEKFKNELKEKD